MLYIINLFYIYYKFLCVLNRCALIITISSSQIVVIYSGITSIASCVYHNVVSDYLSLVYWYDKRGFACSFFPYRRKVNVRRGKMKKRAK